MGVFVCGGKPQPGRMPDGGLGWSGQVHMQSAYGPAYASAQGLPALPHSLGYQKGGFMQPQPAQQQQQQQQRMEVTVPVPEARVRGLRMPSTLHTQRLDM